MDKFKYMTKQEIDDYLATLDVELRSCSFDRMKEIDKEIRAANEAVLAGKYRTSSDDDDEKEFVFEKLNGREAQRRSANGFNPLDTYSQGQMRSIGSFSYGTDSGNTFRGGLGNMNINKETMSEYEKRGADLKAKRVVTFGMDEHIPEMRAVTVGSGTLVVPKHYSDSLSPAFNEVSGLIDNVKNVPLISGNAYSKGFVVGYGEGDYTTEEADYTNADPTFDYVEIGKAKITAYAEMTDESMKLPDAMYQAEVIKAVRDAIRKKVSKQIIAGAGGANAITGIFHAPVNVIPLASDLEITEIDEDTLDKIVMNYGGDEEVEGDACLILNKKDLAVFAALRSSDGKRIYTIKKNGNTGTISSDGSFDIKFIINSACPALSLAETQENTYCMAYGKMVAYELPIFSELTVEESRDFKFKSGHVCYRGSVWIGGNVAMYKGFTRIKKIKALAS